MRIVIDLPDDLNHAAKAVALDTRAPLNDVMVDLVQRGLCVPAGSRSHAAATVRIDPASGLPRVRSSQSVSLEDVRALEDEP